MPINDAQAFVDAYLKKFPDATPEQIRDAYFRGVETERQPDGVIDRFARAAGAGGKRVADAYEGIKQFDTELSPAERAMPFLGGVRQLTQAAMGLPSFIRETAGNIHSLATNASDAPEAGGKMIADLLMALGPKVGMRKAGLPTGDTSRNVANPLRHPVQAGLDLMQAGSDGINAAFNATRRPTPPPPPAGQRALPPGPIELPGQTVGGADRSFVRAEPAQAHMNPRRMLTEGPTQLPGDTIGTLERAGIQPSPEFLNEFGYKPVVTQLPGDEIAYRNILARLPMEVGETPGFGGQGFGRSRPFDFALGVNPEFPFSMQEFNWRRQAKTTKPKTPPTKKK